MIPTFGGARGWLTTGLGQAFFHPSSLAEQRLVTRQSPRSIKSTFSFNSFRFLQPPSNMAENIPPGPPPNFELIDQRRAAKRQKLLGALDDDRAIHNELANIANLTAVREVNVLLQAITEFREEMVRLRAAVETR
jgi:hypothetical protein